MHSIYTKKNQRVVAGPGTSALPPPTSTMDKDSATGDDDDNETETTKPASLEAKEGGKSNDAKGKDFLEGNELGNETEVNGETNKEEDTARERDNDKKPESLPNESASDEEIEESRPAKRKADSGAKRNDQDRQDEGLLKEDVKKKKTKTVEEDSMPSMKFPGVFVTETNDRDVLQGRGSGSNLYQGNMVYRDMIEEVATSYTSTTSRKEKNRLVNELITVIHGMNGRFLHPVDNDEAVKLGLDPSKDFFYEITDADAVDKVKQAIRYVHYKKRPLMEQRRKAAAQRGESSSMLREDDRKMPTRPVSVDESSNTDPAIQQLLRNLPSGTSTAAPSRVQSGNSVSSQPFHLLHQQLLLQQQLQGSDTTSSQVGSNTLADVLEGLQHQRQGDQGGLQRMLQQQMLLQQLRQLQLEQEQSRQQQQQLLQTLIHMQPEQRVDQQALLSALATASGQQQGSTSTRPPAHSSQLFSSLLQQLPVQSDLPNSLQSQIQQLFLQRTQQSQQNASSSASLQDTINGLLRQQQQRQEDSLDRSASASTSPGRGPYAAASRSRRRYSNESDISFDSGDDEDDLSYRQGKHGRDEPRAYRSEKSKRRKS